MNGFICPYCYAGLREPDLVDVEPGVTYEEECESCGKNFVFDIEYDVVYREHQAPCKNGGEHDWRPITGYPEWAFKGNERCSYCDERRQNGPKGVCPEGYFDRGGK
jgi:hypothetical protein